MTTHSVGSRRSAVRQTVYVIEVPPNDYTVGDAGAYLTRWQDLLGLSRIRFGAINNTAFNLEVQAAAMVGDVDGDLPIVEFTAPSVADAVSGMQILSGDIPVTYRYYRLRFRPTVTLGARFRLIAKALPHG